MIVLTKEQSKTLTLLKGFAIILVVMIHCDVRNAMGVEHLSGLDLYMQGLTRVIVINAVPLFFFISGYLFFLKKDTYSEQVEEAIQVACHTLYNMVYHRFPDTVCVSTSVWIGIFVQRWRRTSEANCRV